MKDPVTVNVKSITTQGVQTLILDSIEGDELRGKRVIVVDDVISTGESLRALEELLYKFDCDIVAKTAILSEGDSNDRDDIIVLGQLPLIKK